MASLSLFFIALKSWLMATMILRIWNIKFSKFWLLLAEKYLCVFQHRNHLRTYGFEGIVYYILKGRRWNSYSLWKCFSFTGKEWKRRRTWLKHFEWSLLPPLQHLLWQWQAAGVLPTAKGWWGRETPSSVPLEKQHILSTGLRNSKLPFHLPLRLDRHLLRLHSTVSAEQPD